MCPSGTQWRRRGSIERISDSPRVQWMHHISVNIDTTDSRVSCPKHTAWKKEAWWGRDATSGSSHWKCVRFDDSDENVFSLSFPKPQPQGSCNWLWWVWIMSSGRGRPSRVPWHSCAVTWRPPGSWEPGTAFPSQRAGGSSSRGSCSPGPAPDFYVLWPASFVKYHLAGSLSSGFWGEGTALRLRKLLVCFRQLDLGEKMPIPLLLAQGFWVAFFPEAERHASPPPWPK